jgi:hypothetical protein
MNEYTKYLPFKSVLESLFGRDVWYALKESNHLPTWRKYGVKTLKAVLIAINSTVEVADEQWREDIAKTIADGISKIEKEKDIDEIIAALAATMIKVSFLQIGLMPDKRGSAKSTILRQEAFQLNSFRTVIYTQTETQKENLFLTQQREEIGFDKQLDLQAEYRRCNSKLSYSQWCKSAKKTK